MTAESTAEHRVLVFRACAKGHCFSDTYLQWLQGQPPEVLRTSQVHEFGEGVVVRSVRWARDKARPTLVAIIDTRREGAPPLTLYLIPAEPGYYQVHR